MENLQGHGLNNSSFPDACPVLSDLAYAVEGNGQHFAIKGEGEGKTVALFKLQLFKGMEFDGIGNAIVDADVERTFSERVIPPDAVQQLPDRFHTSELSTTEP